MEDAAAQAPNTQSEWQITALSNLDLVVLIALALAAVGLALWTWRSLDPAFSRGRKVTLLMLRIAAIVVCFGILLQPTLHKRELRAEPAHLAILVDTSPSMAQGGDNTRLLRAKRMLKTAGPAIARLEKRYRIDWYGFSDGLVPVASPEALGAGEGKHRKTDIRGALQALMAGAKKVPIDGVVLISDGADTELVPQADGESDLTWAEAFGVPINTIAVGDAPDRVELAITHVEAAPFAFTRSDTPITVRLRSVGLEDRRVEAFLKQDGTVVQRREVQLVGGRGQLTFTALPTALGQQVMEVSVPVPEGDEVPENNLQHLTFEVIRDKFRILHLAGRPSWDQRFLRDALKSWPRVDLVSFYVLRTGYQSATEGSAGMALIPFPTDDLFKDHLGEFDILIFHEFEPAEVGVEAYAGKIAEFVRDGGALVLIGGEKGLKGGTMGGPALEAIFPVELLSAGTPASRMSDSGQFRAKLTEDGANHPITRLYPDDERNRQVWRSLTRLDGQGRIAGLAEGAHSLLENPFLLADDGPTPVVAVKEVEKGRTLAITTDSLWRWRFSGPVTGGPADLYTDFWRKTIAWLTRAPDLKRLRVKVSPAPLTIGDAADIDVELLDESYRPLGGQPITSRISWIGEDGAEGGVSFDAKVDRDGRYRHEWRPTVEGAHSITVTADNGLTNTQRFLVVTDDRERHHLDLQESLLRELAETTDGDFKRNLFDDKGLAMSSAKGREVVSQLALTLWDHPAFIGLFLLFVFAEWLMRRRMGMD